MKAWVQKAVRDRGYEIRKAPYAKFTSVPSFDLALHYIMKVYDRELKFVEVGANDGKSTDPLHWYVVNKGWRGLLIEPQPDVFERLKANYSDLADRLLFENVAISKETGFLTLYRAPQKDNTIGAATVVSWDPKTTARQLGIPVSQLEQIKVPTARLDDVLAKHHFTDVDVLQLDTEGLDWDVLQTIDLTKTRPLVIGFEHGHLPASSIGKMVKHLNDHEYFVHFGGYESDSYALRQDVLTK